MARKGLGQGLGALLGSIDADADRLDGAVPSSTDVTTLGIDKMAPSPFQPRQQFDPVALEQLAQSLASNGMLQPILVRPSDSQPGQYEIVAGERRWRAAQIAQLHDVPVVVRTLNNRQTLEAAVLENVQRQDLSAIEEARGYNRLVADFNYSAQEIADGIGKSRPHVVNTLRLLELPENVQKLADQGKISAGHARAIIGVDNAVELARMVLEQGLSVRQLEAIVRKQRADAEQPTGAPIAPTPKKSKKDADTLAVEKQMTELLGLQVSIDETNGKGTITFSYSDYDQLDDVLRRLGYDG